MLKQLLLKKMIASRLNGVPPQQRDAIIKAIDENPDLFMQLAQEADTLTKSGMSQGDAARKVFERHGDDLRRLLGQ